MDKSKLSNLKRRIKEQCNSQSTFPSTISVTNHGNNGSSSLKHTYEDTHYVSGQVTIFNDKMRLKSSIEHSKHDNFSPALSARHNNLISVDRTLLDQESFIDSTPVANLLLESNSLKPTMSVSVKWICNSCSNQCLPVIRESRCLCGHRMKEHPPNYYFSSEGATKSDTNRPPFMPCVAKNCKCKSFLYVVAEGSWVLRCRCKHKHIEHDCSRAPFTCLNQKCVRENLCQGFDSPWVCNCGHLWSAHSQLIDYKSDPGDDSAGT